tara:strand:+ start:772 stop:936 length:165 start_codon:yes stop_codon:yes gene_type:complete
VQQSASVRALNAPSAEAARSVVGVARNAVAPRDAEALRDALRSARLPDFSVSFK